MSYQDNYKEILWAEFFDAVKRSRPPARSNLACPHVIGDTMPETQSMLDGKYYTSKSVLRSTYRAAGVTEVGNEKPKPRVRPKTDRKAVKTSLQKAEAAFNRGERVKKT